MPPPWSIRGSMATHRSTKGRLDALAGLVAAQHGVVSRAQLLSLGFDGSWIKRRLASGYLIRIYRGVYAIGRGDLRREGHFMAAVLACGEGAALSHLAAMAHWGLLASAASKIDVTIPRRRRVGSGPRLRVHRARLSPGDITRFRRIPTTTVERTLLDLADVVSSDRVREAFEQAQSRHLLDVDSMRALLARSPGRRGLAVVGGLVEDAADEPPELRSRAERELLDLIRAAGLPLPVTNAVVDGITVDAFWPRHGLVVEVDGYAYHRSRRQFETDHERTELLQRAGLAVMRFTARRIREHRGEVAAAIRVALERAAGARAI